MSRVRIWQARGGAVAVEFAILSQVFAVIFAGTVEIGIIHLKRQQLSTSLAAAANYAMVNPSAVTASGGAVLATTLTTLLRNDGTSTTTQAIVVINNGPSRTVDTTVTTGGTASDADRCYCPTGSSTISWGSAVTCGSACASGLRAGKFVELRLSRAQATLFGGFGTVPGGRIALMSLVQVE